MSEPRLRITHVSKRFGPTAALDGVHLADDTLVSFLVLAAA
jgi:hypothetical protein